MALFDPYTTKILLEATLGSGVGGGAGYGGPSPFGEKKKKLKKKSKIQTPSSILYGTAAVPPGTNIQTQAMIGGWKQQIDPLFDYYWDKTAGKVTSDPLVKFGAKQALKTELAMRYLGGGGLAGYLSKSDTDPKTGLTPEDKESLVSSLGGVGSLLGTKKSNRFGKLGTKVAEKLPQLAAMGIDPLDWATKTFGADDALRAFTSIPEKTRASLAGSMGYLQKGRSRGFY